MTEERVEIVRRLYEAVARRDTATVLSIYDPEIEWDHSNARVAELMGRMTYRGHEGLRQWFRDWYDAWESVEAELKEVIDAGEHVVVVLTYRGRGRASGVDVELDLAGVFTFRNRKIVRAVWFRTRGEALGSVGTRDK